MLATFINRSDKQLKSEIFSDIFVNATAAAYLSRQKVSWVTPGAVSASCSQTIEREGAREAAWPTKLSRTLPSCACCYSLRGCVTAASRKIERGHCRPVTLLNSSNSFLPSTKLSGLVGDYFLVFCDFLKEGLNSQNNIGQPKEIFVFLQKCRNRLVIKIDFCRNTERTNRGSFCKKSIFPIQPSQQGW